MANSPVRVSIPASVAANIDTYKQAVSSVLKQLGCPECCSGHDIQFDLQRDLVLQKHPKDLMASLNNRAEVAVAPKSVVSKQSAFPTVRVGVHPELVNNIEGVFATLDRIADLSGHPACATGCDMRFNLEQHFVVDTKVQVSEQVLSLG